MQRESISRGETTKTAPGRIDTSGPGLRREIRALGPADETIGQRSERYFGEWKPSRGNPAKFAKKENPSNGDESAFYPKYYGLTDFRIEERVHPKPQTTVWDWAKIAFEKAFGIKIE